jgi:hypothetical protein
VSEGYTADQRRRLQDLLRAGQPLVCPACGGSLTQQRVAPPGEVSYVRRRVLLICTVCRRSAALDRT